MNRVFDVLSENERNKLEKMVQPGWLSPMLATLTRDHFSGNDWIYERKLDGERCLIFKAGNTVKLMSRNKKEINARYPEITGAFNTMSGNFIVDGEIVSFRDNVTSFSRLQKRMHSKEPDRTIPVFYYAFDMMHFDGYSLTHLPLRSRKIPPEAPLNLIPGG